MIIVRQGSGCKFPVVIGKHIAVILLAVTGSSDRDRARIHRQRAFFIGDIIIFRNVISGTVKDHRITRDVPAISRNCLAAGNKNGIDLVAVL